MTGRFDTAADADHREFSMAQAIAAGEPSPRSPSAPGTRIGK